MRVSNPKSPLKPLPCQRWSKVMRRYSPCRRWKVWYQLSIPVAAMPCSRTTGVRFSSPVSYSRVWTSSVSVTIRPLGRVAMSGTILGSRVAARGSPLTTANGFLGMRTS